jgi:hypothetical protein
LQNQNHLDHLAGGQMNISSAKYIRKAFEKLGTDASFREIREYIKAENPNLGVKPQQVSNERRKRLRPKPPEITADFLKQLKALVDQLGSIEATRKALDTLEEILGKK